MCNECPPPPSTSRPLTATGRRILFHCNHCAVYWVDTSPKRFRLLQWDRETTWRYSFPEVRDLSEYVLANVEALNVCPCLKARCMLWGLRRAG